MKKEEWIIEVKELSYTYDGNYEKALDHVSLKIRRGQKIAFVGGNGSGKSTFFLCLNGILRPDEGEIKIDGKEIIYTRKGLLEVRKKIGIVFQEPDTQLFSGSVYQDIAFGILNLGADEKTARLKVEKVMDELEIRPFCDKPVHALSGGQKKQVAIADILVMDPDIIILDEPAAGLDPKHVKITEDIIDRLTQRGITVLMATHDIDYAYAWADEMVLMNRGKIVDCGIPRKICADKEKLLANSLEPPAVLRLYEKLSEKGLLDKGKSYSLNLKEFIEQI